jgi:glycosyltransferase involved in cell wall biosynthesis
MTVTQARTALKLDSNAPMILAVGRLSEEKAFDELIRAVAPLSNAKLMIVGEGHDRPRLEALIQELNLNNRVTLAGWRSDVRQLYQAADVLALSSHREGLPNVLLEALALETPVVSTDVNGIPRLIQHDVNGLLVKPGDVNAMTASLQTLLGSVELQARFRVAGRNTVLERFSFAARIERLADDYDRLLRRAPR